MRRCATLHPPGGSGSGARPRRSALIETVPMIAALRDGPRMRDCARANQMPCAPAPWASRARLQHLAMAEPFTAWRRAPSLSRDGLARARTRVGDAALHNAGLERLDANQLLVYALACTPAREGATTTPARRGARPSTSGDLARPCAGALAAARRRNGDGRQWGAMGDLRRHGRDRQVAPRLRRAGRQAAAVLEGRRAAYEWWQCREQVRCGTLATRCAPPRIRREYAWPSRRSARAGAAPALARLTAPAATPAKAQPARHCLIL